jgi:hypothetical protein
MCQFMMTMIALTAFGAMVATAQAENQTPHSSRSRQRFHTPWACWGIQPTAGHMHWVEIGMHLRSHGPLLRTKGLFREWSSDVATVRRGILQL